MWSVALALALLADQDVEDLPALVKQLADPSIEVRSQAEGKLKMAPVKRASEIQALLKQATDPEVRSRLAEIHRHLLCVESKRLLSEGDLRGALSFLAKADCPADPENYLLERTAKVKQELLGWFLPQDPAQHSNPRPDYAAMAARIRKTFGLWAMPTLVEALGDFGPGFMIPADRILVAYEAEDSVPGLCQALESSSRQAQANACGIIRRILLSRRVKKYPRLQPAVQRIYDDPKTQESVRSTAGEVLKILGSLDDEGRPKGN